MITDSPHLYIRQGIARNRPIELLENAVEHAYRPESNGLQAVLSLNHLAHLTGASHQYLRGIVSRRTDPYRDFRVHGRRRISAPDPALQLVQRWILDNILAAVPCDAASFAYERNKSIVGCAQRHLSATWIIKTDFHEFFASIDESSVYRVFLSLGYSRLISFELARICTRPGIGAKHKNIAVSKESRSRYQRIPDYVHAERLGYLPQGAPTSGALSNLAIRELDKVVSRIARSSHLVYTRYADDLTFSTSSKFSRAQAQDLIGVLGTEFHKRGFLIHQRKTRVVPPGSRKIVLGLLVDGDKVRLLPEFRRRLENDVRGVEKFGLSAHVAHRGYASMRGFINHVHGALAFSYGVDAEWAGNLWGRWSRVLE
jgi:RNA-directed DNA polymerase